jgi:hypothetical protein
MSTIQELGNFLAREQTAATTPAPPATTPAKADGSSSPTGELPETEAGFNTDYNGAPAART